jgi:hypothetical protein
LVLGSWLSAQVWPSNWSLWLSAQDFRQATATGHSSCPHKSHPHLDTPAPLILRRMDNKVCTSSLMNWTLPGLPPPKLRLTLVISTRVPKHRPVLYITPTWTPGCLHKFSQASEHSGCQHRIGIEQLGIPIIRTRVPKQLDIPIILAGTMVPGHWTMDDSICTSVS